MKLLLFFLTLIGLFVYFPYTHIAQDPFSKVESFEIVIKGEVDQITTLVVKPYTQIKDILNQIKITDQADLDALDFNYYLVEADVVTIPKKREQSCISINQASFEELQALNGIGPATAQSIIDYRKTQGLFLLVEDLMRVKGIGPKKFERIQEMICL